MVGKSHNFPSYYDCYTHCTGLYENEMCLTHKNWSGTNLRLCARQHCCDGTEPTCCYCCFVLYEEAHFSTSWLHPHQKRQASVAGRFKTQQAGTLVIWSLLLWMTAWEIPSSVCYSSRSWHRMQGHHFQVSLSLSLCYILNFTTHLFRTL